jgi:hypothetical protein
MDLRCIQVVNSDSATRVDAKDGGDGGHAIKAGATSIKIQGDMEDDVVQIVHG